ncbi:MAG: 2Fe-2S iron-sulfur cluster-binding protein [Rhizobiaceae bacterium]
MPKITIVDDRGTEHVVEAPAGESVMQVALSNAIGGIVAECGGNCACATCHVYVDDAFLEIVPPPQEQEADMLGFTAAERRAGSRLSCQIVLSDAMEGMVVRVPETQV